MYLITTTNYTENSKSYNGYADVCEKLGLNSEAITNYTKCLRFCKEEKQSMETINLILDKMELIQGKISVF